jgi:hypothetical protein
MDYLTYTITPLADSSSMGTDPGAILNTVSLGFPTDGATGYAIEETIQMILKNLLTVKGSNTFNPEEGCALLSMLGAAMNQHILKSLRVEVATVLDSVYLWILDYQAEYDVPEEGLVTGINLQGLSFDPASTTLQVRVVIETNTASVPIVFNIENGGNT